jgi:hypothetical protein
MDDNDRRTLEKFVRVRDFGQPRATDFTPASVGQQLFIDIGTVVTDFNRIAADEASGRGEARQGTERRAQAREALRDALEAINLTARALGNEVPGIGNKLRLPRGSNDRELINAARAFKAEADPLKAQFIAHEMPADFLEDLDEKIATFETAISDQSSGVGSHVAAGAAMEDVIDRGNDIVRKLDAIVRNKYRDNPADLAEWTSASHTERAPRRAKPATGTPTPTPGPVTPG